MFKSTLKFQSKEFDIRFVDYEIKRDVDAKGVRLPICMVVLSKLPLNLQKTQPLSKTWLVSSNLTKVLLCTRREMKNL